MPVLQPCRRREGRPGRPGGCRRFGGKLLAIAQAKAAAEGLDNLEFRADDMLALGYPDGYFDAVVCVFGIFRSRHERRGQGTVAASPAGRAFGNHDLGPRFIRTRQQRALASHSQRTARTLQRLQSLGSDIHPGRIVGDAV